MKKKYLPNGWRMITPSEKVKAGDMFIADSVIEHSRTTGKQLTTESCCPVWRYWFGHSGKSMFGKDEAIKLFVITPVRAKNITSQPAGTELANTPSAGQQISTRVENDITKR